MPKPSNIQVNPSTGYPIDPITGEDIHPGDPRWKPEWDTVLKDLRSIPSGMHRVGGGTQLARNDVPWYRDPALLGAIALPAAAVAAPALAGAGAGATAPATATGAVGAGSTLGMSSALPGALSTVGGAGTGAAGAGTAAGVGSWIQRGLKGAQGVSDVLGGAADRAERSNAIRDELALAASRAKLGQSEFATTAPAERLRTSLKAAMAKHATPTSVSWGGPGSGLRGQLPQFSGGVKSAITAGQQEPGTSDLMNNIIQDQAAAQKRGGITGGGTDYDPGLGSNFGQSSGLDKAVGAGAFGSSILAALGKSGVLDRYRSPQVQPLNIPDTWVGGY